MTTSKRERLNSPTVQAEGYLTHCDFSTEYDYYHFQCFMNAVDESKGQKLAYFKLKTRCLTTRAIITELKEKFPQAQLDNGRWHVVVRFTASDLEAVIVNYNPAENEHEPIPCIIGDLGFIEHVFVDSDCVYLKN